MFAWRHGQYDVRNRGAVSAAHELDDELAADVEALSGVRTRELVLTPRLIELYGRTTWGPRSHAMMDLSLAIILLNLIGLALDWLSASTAIADLMAAFRVLLIVVYAAAIVGLSSQWGRGREGRLVIGPAVVMLALVGAVGMIGGPVLLERLMVNAMFGLGAIIVLAGILPKHTALLVAVTIGMMAGFFGVSPGHTASEKLQLVTFYAVGILALGQARLIMNRSQQKLFVLDLSARARLLQVSELNARLYDAARTDPLTGLANRRSFDESFELFSAAADVAEGPVCVCMIDIDQFKRLNDLLGHRRGDECLQAVANALRDVIRESDGLVARFGGEEFVALLPNASLEDGVVIAERMRRAVYALDLPNPGSPWRRVTVSIGVAANPQAPVGVLLGCADDALYQAKTLGRDRVFAYETFRVVDAAA